MGVLSSGKTISKSSIKCGEEVDITLSLSASPDINTAPKEIVLVLDRSGSMSGTPIDELKKAALKFLDIIDVESDGVRDKVIGAGSKVALVTFSSNATVDSELTSRIQPLEDAVNAIRATGSTNHKDALIKAVNLLSGASGKEKIIVMFTDGTSNAGQEGYDIAKIAKDRGISVYCILYGQSSASKQDAVEKWASSPASAYSLITPSLAEVEKAFVEIVQNISKSGATSVSLKDTVNSCFEIIGTPQVSVGNANILDKNNIVWEIDELGVAANESATCTFKVKHNGSCSGKITINSATDYTDAENNIVNFKSPEIYVDCTNPPVIPEPCPVPADITIEGCKDSAQYTISDAEILSQGRILQFNLKLKSICPNKPVALAVLLYERDAQGTEYSRGMKTVLIPAQSGNTCTDIDVRCINFAVPEIDFDGNPASLCRDRLFSVRAFANYLSTDFVCCE